MEGKSEDMILSECALALKDSFKRWNHAIRLLSGSA